MTEAQAHVQSALNYVAHDRLMFVVIIAIVLLVGFWPRGRRR